MLIILTATFLCNELILFLSKACSDSTRREEMPVDVAFETVRKVVYIIISAKTIQCETKQNQLDALANEKIQVPMMLKNRRIIEEY